MKKIFPMKSGRLISPPYTKKIRAGYNVLKPGQSVGEHTTGKHEEIIIVLKGEALLTANGKKSIVRPNHMAYNPPHTVHNVTNSGKKILRYIYVVA